MALGDNNMFPLVDRQTPVIDRVRGAANSKFLGKSMGKTLAELMLEKDQEERSENAGEIADWFTKQLAQELGLPEEAISPDVASNVEQFFTGMAEEDILTPEAMQELGLDPDSEDEDNDSDSDDDESDASDEEGEESAFSS